MAGGLILAVVLCGVWGCSRAPVQKVEDARRAVESARRAEAEKYAAQEFRELEDSLKVGLIEVDRQNAKFSLFKDYETAQRALEWVDARADGIAEQAQENKEGLKRVTADLFQSASAELEEATRLVARVPRRQDSLEELSSFRHELKLLRSSLEEVMAQLGAENFSEAQHHAKAIQTRAERLQREARAVAARYGDLRPGRGRR